MVAKHEKTARPGRRRDEAPSDDEAPGHVAESKAERARPRDDPEPWCLMFTRLVPVPTRPVSVPTAALESIARERNRRRTGRACTGTSENGTFETRKRRWCDVV